MSQSSNHLLSLVSHPVAGNLAGQLLGFYEKRLWHQVTVTVEKFINDDNIKNNVDLVSFFRLFVWEFASKINQLTLAHIAIKISKSIQDLSARTAFLKEVADSKSVGESKEAHILLRSVISELRILQGSIDAAVVDLDQSEKQLDDMIGQDTTVFAAYYKARTLLYKVKNQPQEFYKNGLQYLGYAKMDQIDKEERSELAFDLAIAALVGSEIYNFGELIQNQIFDALKGTPKHQWLADVLEAFNGGNITQWKGLEKKYSNELNAQPALVSNRKLMEQKISILSVMELVFSKGAVDRAVTFQTISDVSQLPIGQVELLLMRALSLGLIKGRIDQTTQTVNVHWVQPRVLSLEQIDKMKTKLGDWSKNVKEALHIVENHLTPELLS